MTLRHPGAAWLVAWLLCAAAAAAAAAALHREDGARVWTGQQGDASREPWLEIIRCVACGNGHGDNGQLARQL